MLFVCCNVIYTNFISPLFHYRMNVAVFTNELILKGIQCWRFSAIYIRVHQVAPVFHCYMYIIFPCFSDATSVVTGLNNFLDRINNRLYDICIVPFYFKFHMCQCLVSVFSHCLFCQEKYTNINTHFRTLSVTSSLVTTILYMYTMCTYIYYIHM